MKAVFGLWAVIVALSLAPAVSAVTVDLASPQEGTTLAPGDALQLSLTVNNETENPDLVVLVLDVQVGSGVPGDGVPEPAPGNIPGISHKPIRIKVAPGASVTRTLELVLPLYKQLPAGEYAVTITVEAVGLISQIQSSDSVSFLLVKP